MDPRQVGLYGIEKVMATRRIATDLDTVVGAPARSAQRAQRLGVAWQLGQVRLDGIEAESHRAREMQVVHQEMQHALRIDAAAACAGARGMATEHLQR